MSANSPTWLPYCGEAPTPGGWLLTWNLDPVLLAAMIGGAALWWRFGDRSAGRAAVIALALTTALYVSPLCALGSALFTARVVHHVLLAVALAPLLVSAFAIRRVPGSLALWTGLQALVLWLWHAPPLYAAALASDAVFWTMQLSITLAATGWWAKLSRSEAGPCVLSLLATMVQMGLLGAILTFGARAYYAPHWFSTQSWGLRPIEDQQIAGLVMWAPASAFYLLAALIILHRSLAPARAR